MVGFGCRGSFLSSLVWLRWSHSCLTTTYFFFPPQQSCCDD
ncbi:hypothetical protein Goklo_003874, partial [Gossypium klotzschianum]|nr:hypothetical protein [Gossypium klotzschianum]